MWIKVAGAEHLLATGEELVITPPTVTSCLLSVSQCLLWEKGSSLHGVLLNASVTPLITSVQKSCCRAFLQTKLSRYSKPVQYVKHTHKIMVIVEKQALTHPDHRQGS